MKKSEMVDIMITFLDEWNHYNPIDSSLENHNRNRLTALLFRLEINGMLPPLNKNFNTNQADAIYESLAEDFDWDEE